MNNDRVTELLEQIVTELRGIREALEAEDDYGDEEEDDEELEEDDDEE